MAVMKKYWCDIFFKDKNAVLIYNNFHKLPFGKKPAFSTSIITVFLKKNSVGLES